MKWALWSATVLGILTASTATAQHARVSAGYGRMLPTGEYLSVHEAGWQFMGAVEAALPRTPLGLRADGMYGGTRSRSVFDVGTTKLTIVTASLVCHIGAPVVPLHPYLLAGVGYSVDEPGYDAAFAGGGGLSVGTGPWKPFVETRFITAGSIGTSHTRVTVIAVIGGLSFGL
jgi:hypothetical protein